MTCKANSTLLFSLGVTLLTLPTISAAPLAYEGFATDATGSGSNYQENTILQGVNKSRSGFTGVWYESDAPIAASVNSRSMSGGLSYAGYAPGTPGEAHAYRDSGSAGAGKVLSRDLTISNPALSSSGKYYFSALVDFNGASAGGIGFETAGSRDNDFLYNGSTVTFQSSGVSGDSHSFSPLAGTNLLVVEYTNDTTFGTNPNTDFYTRWNLWVNPDLSGGSLGSATASGNGIGFLSGGSVNGPTALRLISSNLPSGQNIRIDEVYFSTDSGTFVIPEPSSLLLMLGAGLALLCLRKRS